MKAALHAKSKATKKHFEHQVSMAAIGASMPNSLLPNLQMGLRPINELKGLKKRVRKSEKEQVKRVAQSLKKFGQVAPILLSATGRIINGHVVAEAMKELGQKEVWCVVVDHLDENELNLLHVTLNRIEELGDWDLEALGPLLIELEDVGLDLSTTGFLIPELDIIMSDPTEKEGDPGEEEDLEPSAQPVTIEGDLWVLDQHRLLCADATRSESYERVLEGSVADAILTDLPWNIPIEGFVSGLGKTKHKNFLAGAGELSDTEFAAFCDTAHLLSSAHLIEGGVFFSFIDWRSADVIMAAGRKAGLRHIGTAIWDKGSGGMGSLYRSAHEQVIIFCKGPKIAVNNVQLGKHGRDRTNIWRYPGANRPGSSANAALAYHPTPKPVGMIMDALMDVSKRGALVLDPFLGSGTTILAAERSGRRACGIELDPGYVDVAIRRWQELTSKCAVHAQTGLTYTELAQQRWSDDESQAAA